MRGPTPGPRPWRLQNPTLLEAELGRRRARDGTDRDVLAWIEATFGVRHSRRGVL